MRKVSIAVLLIVLAVPAMLFARTEGKFDRTLTVNGPVTLDLTTGSGNVTVHAGGSNEVVIHGVVRGSNDWFGGDSESAVRSVESNPPIEQNGNSIRVGYNLSEDVKRHVSISYDVTVPGDTSLQAHSGSGDIGVQGVRKSAVVTTGSGDVTLRDIGPQANARTGSGTIKGQDIALPFTARTGSGGVRADLTGSGNADVESGSGDVELRGMKGGLHARTGSGDITVDGAVSSGWNLHTGSGSVRLALGSAQGFNLYARTGSGSIHSDLPITMQGSLNRHELKGAVKGGGPEVEVSTGSGDIELK
jgi:DUF4097 and DUF4098 domain-containing protein YvlB